MTYDELLITVDQEGLLIKEKTLFNSDGRIRNNRIAIRKDLTSIEKTCVLAEELGHYYTTVGDILEQNNTVNRKQEQQARTWAYNRLIGLAGIINAYKAGCQSIHDMADYFEVTDTFLMDALNRYRAKYGTSVNLDNYVIFFEPYIGVLELV